MTTICVDLDGVLCEEVENPPGDYPKAKPKRKWIEKVNKWSEDGNEIIIYTSRREEDYVITEIWLRKQGVKYDRLRFGKPRADIYIDDRAVNLEEAEEYVKRF